jgi:hypothetical protein
MLLMFFKSVCHYLTTTTNERTGEGPQVRILNLSFLPIDISKLVSLRTQ